MVNYPDKKQINLTEKEDIINFNKSKAKILIDDPTIHKLTDIYAIRKVLDFFVKNFKENKN